MNEAMTQILVAGEALAGLAICLAAALKGWHGWLELKRLELNAGPGAGQGGGPRAATGSAGERIEMADLKERIRKLESLAASIDL
jgi:hypothetical protein